MYTIDVFKTDCLAMTQYCQMILPKPGTVQNSCELSGY